MRIVCIGEAMAEIRADGSGYALGFAGDTFNTAIYCRRALGAKGAVGYLSRIGHEALSEGFVRLALSEGVDVSKVSRDPDRNIGIYSVQTDAAGERSFAYWRESSAARRLFTAPEDFAALNGAELLYFTGITLAILTDRARADFLDAIVDLKARSGVRVAFDSNFRPRLWHDFASARAAISQAWALTDIAFPSLDDEMLLFDDKNEQAVLERLRKCGCRRGALKRGAFGPIPIDPELAPLHHLARAKKVIDTTGAGDSFNGAFLSAYMQSEDPNVCMSRGHELACEVIGFPGAISPRPAAATDPKDVSH